MVVTRKEKETNQQVLRRFNRALQQNDLLKIARNNQFFKKELNRFGRRRDAVRKMRMRDEKQWY